MHYFHMLFLEIGISQFTTSTEAVFAPNFQWECITQYFGMLFSQIPNSFVYYFNRRCFFSNFEGGNELFLHVIFCKFRNLILLLQLPFLFGRFGVAFADDRVMNFYNLVVIMFGSKYELAPFWKKRRCRLRENA